MLFRPYSVRRWTHYCVSVLGMALVISQVACSNNSLATSSSDLAQKSESSESTDDSTQGLQQGLHSQEGMSEAGAGDRVARDETNAEANAETLAAIAAARVIYLGETHTSEGDHLAQLEIIKAIASQSEIASEMASEAAPGIAIGLEMFQRPFQPVLDSYLAGEMTEAELIEQSEYETRWGYDWEFYAPIIRYAKAQQIPLIALNTPTEVTRQVAREGLESLSGDALTHIPPIEEVDTTDAAYRESLMDIFSAHGGSGHSTAFENFFAAQVLWDETMAERIVAQLTAEPERQVIVLVGEGHIAYDYGIPNRVERRVPEIEQASVQLLDPAEQPIDTELADFVWLTKSSSRSAEVESPQRL